jgi:hypothetical protein
MFGLGPSASGFAIAAAAVMGDEATGALLKAAALAGLPEMQSGELRYMTMPVGQAVILFGKTELLLTMTRRGKGK